MIKKVAILCTLLCVAFVSQAQEVRINITAGTLSEVVNQDFTSLAITGTILPTCTIMPCTSQLSTCRALR